MRLYRKCWPTYLMTKNLMVDKKHKHDIVVLYIRKGGRMSVCLICKKVLTGLSIEITNDELNALIEFATYCREEGKAREQQKRDMVASQRHKKRTL